MISTDHSLGTFAHRRTPAFTTSLRLWLAPRFHRLRTLSGCTTRYCFFVPRRNSTLYFAFNFNANINKICLTNVNIYDDSFPATDPFNMLNTIHLLWRVIVQVLGSDCLDIQHAEHAYSGCDIALWDALGKVQGKPVYELLHEYVAAPLLVLVSNQFPFALWCSAFLCLISPQSCCTIRRSTSHDSYFQSILFCASIRLKVQNTILARTQSHSIYKLKLVKTDY